MPTSPACCSRSTRSQQGRGSIEAWTSCLVSPPPNHDDPLVWRVVSCGGRNTCCGRFLQDLSQLPGRRLPVQSFPRAVIELSGTPVQLLLGVVGDRLAARKVLAQKAVGVLVGASLPRAGRITKVNLDAGIDGEADVLLHLPALVPSQRATQVLRQRQNLLGQADAGALRVDAGGKFEEHYESSASLDQGADGGSRSAEQKVALPITRHRPVGSLSWALADVDHVLDLSAVACLVLFGLSNLVTSTQVLGQLLAEEAPALNVEGEVDRLVRNLHRRLPWIFLLQRARNLLWRPVRLETGYHLRPQPRVDRQLGRLGPSASIERRLLGIVSSIVLTSPIPGHLARDRRGRPSNPNGNRAQRVRRRQAARDLFSLLQAERHSRPLPRPGPNAACLMYMGTERAGVPTHVASDSGPRLTSCSSRPQLSDLSLRQQPLRPALLLSLQRHLLCAGQPCLLFMRCCVDPLRRPAKRANRWSGFRTVGATRAESRHGPERSKLFPCPHPAD